MEKRLKSLETIIVLTAGLLALFFWLKNPWLLRVALAVALAGAFRPWLAEKIHAGWTLLAQGLGWFNGRILLSVVFFGFLTPIAWLARRLGSSGFLLRRKPEGESYYTVRDHAYEGKDLESMG